ncbi:MAG: hypothetical protein A2622_10170 [Bdellovibrionales bacterium RIFCSPHIGHO2_01_FULL_40_29]|nr:MAG: hypothetical protein A2622_10170 [Bdellovibrionales bacterium RIFCSPHIGHO2_01_FULL_40_29]OFZ32389.1 MAG: hypothetical protein A3D17_12490 [Bdellovibrionales bacterium RIFCSPHIGHO2_02_FULL_40_15]
MKQQATNHTQKNTTLKVVLILAVVGLLTACGNSKANDPIEDTSLRIDVNAQKPLAHCNKSANGSFSFNTSIVSDQNGQISNEWIKLKFNFISAAITQSGNTIRLFKWRVANGQSVLSETPLQVSAYDFSTGQTVSSPVSALAADQITGSHGYYVNLADPNALFQVIKIVAYDSTGKNIGELNSLIPAFNSNPADYQYNADGTARATLLQQMHALYGVTTTGWTSDQFTQAFSQYCF